MRVTVLIVIAVLVGSVGVGRAEPTADKPSSTSWQKAKEDFAKAYEAVKSGSGKTAAAGRYAIQDLGKGLIRITDKSKQALQKTGDTVEDGWITTKIKGEYATDAQTRPGTQMTVSTDHGVVRLSGTVESEGVAQRAIDIALETKGVTAVDSDLQFPSGYKKLKAHPQSKPAQQKPSAR